MSLILSLVPYRFGPCWSARSSRSAKRLSPQTSRLRQPSPWGRSSEKRRTSCHGAAGVSAKTCSRFIFPAYSSRYSLPISTLCIPPGNSFPRHCAGIGSPTCSRRISSLRSCSVSLFISFCDHNFRVARVKAANKYHRYAAFVYLKRTTNVFFRCISLPRATRYAPFQMRGIWQRFSRLNK